MFTVGATVRGGSTSPLAAELSAQVRPLPVVSASASVQVTTQGDSSATLTADTGLPGVGRVGGGFNFRGLQLQNSFIFGRLSPLEFFTLQAKLLLGLEAPTLVLAGAITPLGFISDAVSLGTTLTISSQDFRPTVSVFGRIAGVDFIYTDGSKPDINVGISIVFGV
ncbi:MAG: hypothetical protein RMK91_04235 [Pseudanabaenaceae cyanobacterium SKYGB_i_bin29]|nr:hypothetical protein [Pseudanabaenaceae cyanobacterium SKYG29]MDW8421053.1 hypothetical protein [Pseudanabaenaceae cyanobacterium SKYGB_i_bin29]